MAADSDDDFETLVPFEQTLEDLGDIDDDDHEG